MSLAYLTIEAGAPLPEHTHPHEQVTNVIEGQLELTIAGETSVLTPGKVAVIPPNMPHSGRALTPCRAIDVFYPVREEYR
jgi:quercetin dioxygenase-like cupin family protein